jgi:hypothetical protein
MVHFRRRESASIAREPGEDDFRIAENLLGAGRAPDMVIAALVYRGLDRQTAEQIVQECQGIRPAVRSRGQKPAQGKGWPVKAEKDGVGLALRSLLFGILTIPGHFLMAIFLLCGLPAVIYGHMASRHIRKSDPYRYGLPFARAGLFFGYLALGVILASILVAVYRGPRL